MDEDGTTNLTRRCLVEVEEPMEKFPCTNPWIESGLMEMIEGDFSLWQKKVPKIQWKGAVNIGKNSQKVVLECENSAFSLVLGMHVRWDKLEFCTPLEDDCFFVFRAGFVVKNLEVH
jgi:hypothetical protein